MSIFSRLFKKKDKKRYYQLPMLTTPLTRKINGNQIYFLRKGASALSLVEKKENRYGQVIEKLDELPSYFNVPYEKLYYFPNTDNLQAYSYSYKPKENLISTELFHCICQKKEEEKVLQYILKHPKDHTFSSKIIYTFFLYKVLLYLNKNGISVKNLQIGDIEEAYEFSYFNRMNALVHLDILDPEDELEISQIVSLCLEYMDINSNLCGKELRNFIDTFNPLKKIGENLFSDLLLIQQNNIKVFSCGHEADHYAIRCPICYKTDILSQEEMEKLEILYQEKEFTLYNGNKDIEGSSYLLANTPSDLNKNIFLKWFETEESGFEKENRSVIEVYNSNLEMIGIKILMKFSDYFFSLEEILEAIFVSKKIHIGVLSRIFKVFEDYYPIFGKYITANIENFDESFCFMMTEREGYFYTFINPILLREENGKVPENYDWDKIFIDKIFCFAKETFHSRVENNEIVSKQIDMLINVNYRFVLEYKKFLMQEEYDANLARLVLNDSISNFREKNIFGRHEKIDYDNEYIVDPKEFKTISTDQVDEYEPEYEWIKETETYEIKEDWDKRKRFSSNLVLYKKKFAGKMLLPEKIVYRLHQRFDYSYHMEYAGYLLKRKDGISLRAFFEEGRFKSHSNKEILNLLVQILDLFWQHGISERDTLKYFKFLYITEDLKDMYMKYQSELEEKEYFSFQDVVRILKKSDIYFSNALELLVYDDFLASKKALAELISTFTKYCPQHKIYYENFLAKCPICYKYTVFMQRQEIVKKGKLIFENDCYQIFKMKHSNIKLYKFDENGMLPNGIYANEIVKNVYQLLENKEARNILDLVMDGDSEEILGVKIEKIIHTKNLLQFLSSNKVTNLDYLNVMQSILNCYFKEKDNFKRIDTLFKATGNLIEVLEGLSYKKNQLNVIDEELFLQNKDIPKEEGIRLLSKMISYIVKSNPKFFELSCISLPEDCDDKYINTVLGKVNKMIEEIPDYCKIHRFYYNQKEGMCPLCAKAKKVLIVHNENELKQMLGENLNFGGESLIYNFGFTQLAKLYNKPINNDPEKNKILVMEHLKKLKARTKLLELSLQLNEIIKEELKSKNFDIVFANQLIFAQKGEKRILKGFIQDKVQDCVPMMSFLNNNVCRELGYDNIPSMLQLLISYGEAIHYLHESETVKKIVPEGLVLGDISGRNILYNKTEKKIAIIDTDSFGTNEYPCTLYTESYTDPILYPKYGHNTFESDWYSYATLCFSMLTKIHPFEGVYQKEPSMKVWDRKLKKISIIGKYEKCITISRDALVDWNWMSEELLEAFVGIFEKGKRFSIVPLLKDAYFRLTGKEYGGQVKREEKIETIEVLEPKKAQVEVLLSLEDGKMIMTDKVVEKDNHIFYRLGNEELLLCDKTFQRGTNECKFLTKLAMIDQKIVDKIVESYIIEDSGVFTMISEGKKYIGYLKEGIAHLLYRITDATREFKILWDQIYDNYLLLAMDRSKSYIVKEKHVIPAHDIYQVGQNTMDEILRKVDHITYFGNSLFYPENGVIIKLDLQTGHKGRLSCDVATNQSFVYITCDGIIVVNSSGIFQMKNE